jgi:hypothetical protein
MAYGVWHSPSQAFYPADSLDPFGSSSKIHMQSAPGLNENRDGKDIEPQD